MLDTATKKRIDDCRDILVGKLPDPKAQIEQITIGLIYKFMDDMDKEAIELGGKAKFFSGSYKKYSWDNLFDTKVTATEMLRLYSEAIVDMDKNPNIPQLFRDIFKNAYLPYRDPETLKLFLKTINEFKYTHSEKLGDAFEYLLSVMGSQGDAGQFRTPRHIIDFIVAAVDPGKGDRVLDPACGTAGFLISAFKHIKEQNKKGLTPDERKKLIQNFVGYDISPDMVRLSLVNLYLHGFSDPHIWEYDTLTSEERWDETADVILANPPFMSPKGGIRPHKKFSITSNRSEVLFVDYIAEHLYPKGRAGIIVPEGVIFQSGTAYKELRKMLVENYLYAVVSLPAGVFNPYSGVKTSILLMDKEFAKAGNEILFVKIENDGYGLGAQRTPVKGSQLEEAIELLQQFKEGSFTENELAHAVARNEIAKNGDYNLSGERYIISDKFINASYDLVELGDIATLSTGGTPKSDIKEYYENGNIKWLVSGDIHRGKIYDCEGRITELGMKESNAKYLPENSVMIALNGQGKTRGSVALLKTKATCNQSLVAITPNDFTKLLPEYLYEVLRSMYMEIRNLTGHGERSGLNMPIIRRIKIPLPPLSIQKEIVAEIEGWQKIIDGAKAVAENYKPKIDIDPDWEMVKMSEITDVNPESKDPASLYKDWFTYIDISSVENGTGVVDYSNKINVSDAPSRARRVVQQNDILLSTVRPNLKAFGFVDREPERFIASTGFALLRTNQKCESKYLYYLVFQDFMINQMVGSMEKGAYPSINQNDVNNLKVALPLIETQRQIVSQIEKEQALVNANKQLIEIFEQKIKDRIAKVWGADKKEGVVYEENDVVTMAAEE